MSFDEATFKSIYEELVFNNAEETASDKIAENLLQLGWLMGQSSIALNHSNDSICAIHEENLRNYQKSSLNNLPKPSIKEGYLDNINISLNADEFDHYLKLPCSDEFLDCKNERITKQDIDALFRNSLDTQIGNSNKRPSSNETRSSNEHSGKKFVFRQSNVNSIVRDTLETPAVQLDIVKHKESNEKLFNSFGVQKIQNSTNSLNNLVRNEFRIRREFNDDDGATTSGRPDCRRLHIGNSTTDVVRTEVPVDQNIPPQIRRNSIQSPNGQPLFAFDKTKKTNSPDATRNTKLNSFITAAELHRQNLNKNGQNGNQPSNTPSLYSYGTSTKTLGTRRSVHSKFVPPIAPIAPSSSSVNEETYGSANETDERLKNIEPKMIELIRSEIMNAASTVDWNDIAGLDYAKRTIQEAVILPLLRPDIFTGLRGPPKGILLFGPPGTGKTLIGRCIASKSKSTFFSISASSLTSKWIGEGEKMVRALFAVAAVNQPAVIFIDEIDSLLSSRSDTEHESSRRLKTEFLVQLDGARTTDDERILIVGATNRPQELDEAARRRLTKRLYIPLPELNARIQILTLLLAKERNQVSQDEIIEIGRLTDGFSGADMKTLCHEALMGPIRSIGFEEMHSIDVNDVRLVNFSDFTNALKRVRASVSQDDLIQYEKWDSTYGLGAGK